MLQPLGKAFKKTSFLFDKVTNGLIFGNLLMILTEGYMQLLTSAFLVFYDNTQPSEEHTARRLEQAGEKSPLTLDKVQQLLALPLAIVICLVCMLGIPAMMIWIIAKPKSEVVHPKFRKRWGYIYDNLHLETRASMCFNLVFYLRRMFFVLSAFVFSSSPGVHFVLMSLLNLMVLIY